MIDLRVAALTAAYRSGGLSPEHVIEEVYSRITAIADNPIWIHLVERDAALGRARLSSPGLPLHGVPFAIKDNIDVVGLPTTAGCPAYTYVAERTATVVQRLFDAGAILIGKTNMDQFATGLTGTRSPYGACHSVFHAGYISGGSSSGSAVAVAAGLASFALGTDTAGSGRVPAAFNNLVGYKPTRGLLSTAGVVPACRSLDCVSVFTLDAADAAAVREVAQGYDPADPYSRPERMAVAPWTLAQVRIGVPSQLEFFGDHAAAELYRQAIDRLANNGAQIVEIDWEPFRAAADLLYSGPWVAERFAAIGPFLEAHASEMNPVVAKIITGGARYTAVEAFRASYRLEELRQQTLSRWDEMDVLALPTTGTTYTLAEVAADPVRLNSNLGYYTNFVNLLDLAAVAVPAGFRPNGLPFGITLIAPAFTDRALLALAHGFHAGASVAPPASSGCALLAVVGAHLTGQPLNHQLTSRGARLVKPCRTAAGYRLYALPNTTPPKPGLVRDEAFAGPGIEVEVWAIPLGQFGGFVDSIPAPLCIGKLVLEDGSLVSGFLCETCAIEQATEISSFGGWRRWLGGRES